jgi:hypothetical protein
MKQEGEIKTGRKLRKQGAQQKESKERGRK